MGCRECLWKNLANLFWNKVDKSGSCWTWTGATIAKGYGELRCIPLFGHTPVYAHRISWELHYGSPPPDDLCVLHSCDNRACVRPKHLFLGTHLDNSNDKIAKGRARYAPVRGDDHWKRKHPEWVARGEDHPMVILTSDEVIEVRQALANGERAAVLSKQFGVSESTIKAIKARRTWRHL